MERGRELSSHCVAVACLQEHLQEVTVVSRNETIVSFRAEVVSRQRAVDRLEVSWAKV